VARPGEIAAVYAAAVVQGVALVTFPAASAIFTSPAHYGLTSEQYGGMFLPQALTAVGAALAGAGLGRRLGIKRIYLLGLAADLVSMVLLVVSQLAAGGHGPAYALLLAATATLGIGFGLTVPALNTFAAAFFPHKVDAAVLVLNALLGLGTALAPAFAALFVGLGFWWGLPVLVAILSGALLAMSAPLPLAVGAAGGTRTGAPRRAPLPARFWLFALAALLYGVVETINGNWATLYMTRHLGASAAFASLALTVFWGTVTAGRMLFAAVETWVPARLVYCGLPLVSAGALAFTAWLPRGDSALGLVSFAMAGLGCSALLPLTISFGHEEMTDIAASVSAGLIAFYQMGYGIAAFGAGPLLDSAGFGLGTVFGVTTIVALALCITAFAVVSHPTAPVAAVRRPKMG